MIRKVQYESQERRWASILIRFARTHSASALKMQSGLTSPVLLSLSRRAARALPSAPRPSVSDCRLSASPEVWLTTVR